MTDADIFEVELEDVYHYRLSYGGQSPYFHGLKRGELVGSCCSGCGQVWVPPRPICSKCYQETKPVKLSGKAEILTVIMLSEAPAHLKHVDGSIATALVRPDGADTCIKAFIIGDRAKLSRGLRVDARFLPEISTIADFYFVPES
ncbi:Zn-ribbon domain-containing OB-fold protein [Sinorhizobium medicae]|uniref:Zn-ribbon domain-containing OB-fold protein n=1 Tax=Sinorhizobium medicae TaxID=110321 RepID=UPI000FD86BFF|nr:zinc ribbon domain-containing protein [Sinorhizobium medicae]RVO73517.1 hypothetical protein CN084_24800 [Sinorhizobium medicae]